MDTDDIDADEAFDPLYLAWHQRELEAYPALFGDRTDGRKYALVPEAFERLNCRDPDPRWTNNGILVYGPTPTRGSTVYASSGLSDPWFDTPVGAEDREVSGLGYELILEMARPEDWALELASTILAYATMIGWRRTGAGTLGHGARFALPGPMDGRDSKLRTLFCVRRPRDAGYLSLETGVVDLIHLVGITDGEADFAMRFGPQKLIEALEAVDEDFHVVDVDRESVV